MSRATGPVLALLAAIALPSCNKTEAAMARRVEAGRVAHAIEILRFARAGHRESEVAALRAVTCSEEKLCRARAVCIEAYEAEGNAWMEMAHAQAALGADAAAAAPRIAEAERLLGVAHGLANRCVDLEGEIRREHRLAQ